MIIMVENMEASSQVVRQISVRSVAESLLLIYKMET